MAVEDVKSEVREFWEAEPCGSAHSDAPEGTPEFFAEVERRRNELEPFIPRYADFASTKGQEVLEIGVGLGSDLIRFARAGAQVSGVDLTEHAVSLVRRRLELEGLQGDIRQADAETLPFEDGAFDVVYSWGVLHHTPRCEQAVQEALRVVRPGGRVCIMLYALNSWVSYGFWVRQALLKGKPRLSRADVLAEHMESKGTRAFTARQMREMFASLDDLRIDHEGTPYDAAFAGPVARATGRRLGWFLIARGTKR